LLFEEQLILVYFQLKIFLGEEMPKAIAGEIMYKGFWAAFLTLSFASQL
jgi:hypothetical protein